VLDSNQAEGHVLDALMRLKEPLTGWWLVSPCVPTSPPTSSPVEHDSKTGEAVHQFLVVVTIKSLSMKDGLSSRVSEPTMPAWIHRTSIRGRDMQSIQFCGLGHAVLLWPSQSAGCFHLCLQLYLHCQVRLCRSICSGI
jgi:hypothetical protein